MNPVPGKSYDHLLIEKRHDPALPAEADPGLTILLQPSPGRPPSPGDAASLLVAADVIARRRRMLGEAVDWRAAPELAAVFSRLPPLGLSMENRRGERSSSSAWRRRMVRLFVDLQRRGRIRLRTRAGRRIWQLPGGGTGTAIAGVEGGDILFVPDSWRKSCVQWLHRPAAWRISRPPRGGEAVTVPAWLCGACGSLQVAGSLPAACPCGGRWERVPETLEPSFIAAAWLLPPPPETVRAPAVLLVASADAAPAAGGLLWLAGAAGLEPPFRETLAVGRLRTGPHPRIRWWRGALAAAHRSYGADALRAALTARSAAGRDAFLSPAGLKGARALTGKLWNAARFALIWGEEEESVPGAGGDAANWALHRLNLAAESVNLHLEALRLRSALAELDRLVRRDVCGWYLEWVKRDLDDRASRQALRRVLETLLRLLHPFLPIITQEIHDRMGGGPLGQTPYPAFDRGLVFPEAYLRMERLRRLTRATRRLRDANQVPPGEWVSVELWARDPREGGDLKSALRYFDPLCRCRSSRIVTEPADLSPGFRARIPGWEIRLPFRDGAERSRAVARLQQEAAALEAEIARLQRQLGAEKPFTLRRQAGKRRLQQAVSRRRTIGETLDDIS